MNNIAILTTAGHTLEFIDCYNAESVMRFYAGYSQDQKSPVIEVSINAGGKIIMDGKVIQGINYMYVSLANIVAMSEC